MDEKVSQEKQEGQWLKGWCGMCLQNDCGMHVRVRDGVVIEVEGNPDCPTNRGKLCVRGGLASIAAYYSPHRIKRPLKRTNPKKGLDEDPGWVEISWDEAYDVIKQAITDTPDRVGSLINLLLISRHLERIADHATNIAEEVVYMIEGEIVRHGRLAT